MTTTNGIPANPTLKAIPKRAPSVCAASRRVPRLPGGDGLFCEVINVKDPR